MIRAGRCTYGNGHHKGSYCLISYAAPERLLPMQMAISYM